MNTFEAIKSRRSLKHYDPNHKFTREEVEKIIDLAMHSPSSFNIGD